MLSKRAKSGQNDKSILMLQNQMNEINRTLDSKIGESTKAMQVGNDVIVQVTTQQFNQVAEALTTVQNATIHEYYDGDKVTSRAIIANNFINGGFSVTTTDTTLFNPDNPNIHTTNCNDSLRTNT